MKAEEDLNKEAVKEEPLPTLFAGRKAEKKVNLVSV
jgi:hypothetical protein